jgi:hypothetical protein
MFFFLIFIPYSSSFFYTFLCFDILVTFLLHSFPVTSPTEDIKEKQFLHYDQPASQSTNQPTSQPANQPTNQPANQPTR